MTLFIAIILFGLALLSGLYWFWSKRIDAEIAEGAEIEWAALEKNEPELLNGYDRAAFGDIYRLVHFPRFPGYALAALVTFVVSLPLTLAAMSGGVWLAGQAGVLPAPVEIAKYIPIGETRAVDVKGCNAECQIYLAEGFGGFFFFFAILGVWLAIFAYFMRRYHQRRPGFLRDEIIRNRPS